MEILNNIWHALISENESLTTIVTLPLLFIETYLSLYIFSYFLKIDCTKKQKLIYVICISLTSIISNFFPAPFNLIFNYAFFFLLIYKLFRLNILKSISALIIPFLLFAIINTLVLNPYLKICNITSTMLNIIPIYKFFYLCLVYLVVCILLFVFKYASKYIKFNYALQVDLDKHTKTVIIINFTLGIFMLCLQAILTFYYINSIPIAFTFLNFILLTSFFLTSFYSLSKLIKLQLTTKELENAESYNNSLTVLYDNVRGFKHDFDNMVNSIGGYIKTDDMEGLKKYYNELEKDCVRVNNVELLNPKIINNSGIYNLIVSKYQKATDLDVKINLEIFFDFNELHMPIYEFSRILGILLDNAIEASKECNEKEINLLFRESRKNNVQIICIENTYLNKNIDTKKIFEKGVSGKENHSGIGLWEINQIIKRNNNVVLHTSKDDDFFKQQLEIYY